jgi:hypothetical protein
VGVAAEAVDVATKLNLAELVVIAMVAIAVVGNNIRTIQQIVILHKIHTEVVRVQLKKPPSYVEAVQQYYTLRVVDAK